MVTEAFTDLPNVRAVGFAGLVTTLCTELGAAVIVKGIRDPADVAYENHMAHMNRQLSGVETVYLPTEPGQSFISSSLVKEVASFGGDVTAFLPAGGRRTAPPATSRTLRLSRLRRGIRVAHGATGAIAARVLAKDRDTVTLGR